MAKQEVFVSSDPADAEVGGLLDDFDGVIEKAEAVLWDYNGKQDDGPALHVSIAVEGQDDNEEVYLSAGSSARVKPAKSGEGFVSAVGARGLNKNSNAMLFIASLVNAGFPVKKLNPYSGWEGLSAHFIRVPQPKRSGLPVDPDEEQKGVRTVLNVSEIHQMPGEGTAKKRKAGGKATPPPEEEEDDDSDDATGEADAAILKLLADKKHKAGIAEDDLATLVFQAVRRSPNKKAILELVQEDDYLTSDDRPFTYEDGTITK